MQTSISVLLLLSSAPASSVSQKPYVPQLCSCAVGFLDPFVAGKQAKEYLYILSIIKLVCSGETRTHI